MAAIFLSIGLISSYTQNNQNDNRYTDLAKSSD